MECVRAGWLAPLIGILVINAVVTHSGESQAAPASTATVKGRRGFVHPAVRVKPLRFFAPTSFWNTPVRRNAPLDPASSSIIGTFAAEIADERAKHDGPWISTTSYGVPIYTVPASQPTVQVQLTSQPFAPALQAAWQQVPLPPDAEPTEGSDGTLVLWQPSRNRLWEFWRLAKHTGGWSASWGGAMEDVSKAAGVYRHGVWPGSQPFWGSSASALSIAGGLITIEDLRQGQINHALAIAIPRVRAGVFASPAKRTDGRFNDELALPEGAHLRLDPSLDLSQLKMPPLVRMIAQAAQRYGIFVRDGASIAHFFAQDPRTLRHNPYLGPNGLFEGKYPGELLASFPWRRLQLLQMDLHPYHPHLYAPGQSN